MSPIKPLSVLVSALALLSLTAAAQTTGSDASQAGSGAAPKPPGTQSSRGVDEPIYGSQLMTPEERNAYHNKMRTAKSAEEHERLRAEHHQQMTARAKERGVTLPEEPPAQGCRGQGAGPGPGMGPGPDGRPGGGPGMGPGPGAGPAR